jgi:lipoprotein-anchoring transpeptidase ErfK/SrfK
MIEELGLMRAFCGWLQKCALMLAVAFGAMSWMAMTSNAAPLRAQVDLSQQRMYVFIDGKKKYTWPVSTGKKGWATKPGSYTPFGQSEKFYSSKWKMSLPYLTWIGQDGTAIHGTYLSKRLGRTASHGCIRLSIGNAKTFYNLVQRYGFWGTEVVVKR